jgi:hypothetical protein
MGPCRSPVCRWINMDRCCNDPSKWLNQSSRRKTPVPVARFPLQIIHKLPEDRNSASELTTSNRVLGLMPIPPWFSLAELLSERWKLGGNSGTCDRFVHSNPMRLEHNIRTCYNIGGPICREMYWVTSDNVDFFFDLNIKVYFLQEEQAQEKICVSSSFPLSV